MVLVAAGVATCDTVSTVEDAELTHVDTSVFPAGATTGAPTPFEILLTVVVAVGVVVIGGSGPSVARGWVVC